MIAEFLAQTDAAKGSDSVSLAALGTFVAAVLGAVGALLAKKKGKEEGKEEEKQRRVSIDGQPIGVKLDERYVTHSEFTAHMGRVEVDITEIKDSLKTDRSVARDSENKVHKRIDAMSERVGDRLGNLEGTVVGIKNTTDKLLDLALADHAKPKGGRQ